MRVGDSKRKNYEYSDGRASMCSKGLPLVYTGQAAAVEESLTNALRGSRILATSNVSGPASNLHDQLSN